MSITVTKNPDQGNAPFFSSGSISFSELRSKFKETGSGSVSASELRRDTNIQSANPVVPDSTENEQISTGSNLSLSQFRNSIKRYLAVQSGTDDNSSYPGEPGLRMGLYASNGRGIDWSGGGVNGRDGRGSNDTGNHIKNVQKTIRITGTCGSVRLTDSSGFITAAAQLTPRLQVNNIRIEVYGYLYGYGGDGGYDPTGYPVGNQSGESGGIGLNLGNIGFNNVVYVSSGARIYGGGGGGEQGGNGAPGSAGTCYRDYTNQVCGGSATCNQGGYQIGSYGGNCCESYSVGWPPKERCGKWLSGIICRIAQTSTTPVQGIGGRGGNGQGYNKPRTNGQNGTNGTCPTCPGGFVLNGGDCGTNGQRGGDGGDWGQDGGETGGRRTRGLAGAAIAFSGAGNGLFTGSNAFDLTGTVNSSTLKGQIYYKTS